MFYRVESYYVMEVRGNQILENLRYATTKLVVTNSKNGNIGTGFFYNVHIDERSTCLLLVTNKHMICNTNNIEDWKNICFRINKEDVNRNPILGDAVSITIDKDNKI